MKMLIAIWPFYLLPHILAASINGKSTAEDYHIGSKLGQGFAGAVFGGRSASSNNENFDLVLKYSSISDRMSAKEILEDLNNEIEIMTTLNTPGHPNVVKLQDSFIDNSTGLPVLVLKKFMGGDLFKWIRRNEEAIKSKSNRPTLYRIMYEITMGLTYIHGKHICHRDLKPANILLRERDIDSTHNANLAITDFGISSEKPKLVRGSSVHASPEIAIARKNSNDNLVNFDCKSADIFALGTLFSELLTTMPFIIEEDLFQHEMSKEIKSQEFINHIWEVKATPEGMDMSQPGGIRLPFEYLLDEEIILLMQMMRRDPNERPKINEILNSYLFISFNDSEVD